MATQLNGTLLGNETPNGEACRQISQMLDGNESIEAYLAFDFGSKVMALTSDRLIVADRDGDWIYWGYQAIAGLPEPNHDREIVIRDNDGDETTFRVGDASVAAFVRQELHYLTSGYAQDGFVQDDAEDGSAVGIAERVRFWEEQDKINQELIPRVIRQHELLTQHIGEHDNLPAVVSQAVAQALSKTRADLEQRYSAVAAETKAEIARQAQADKADLEQRYAAALEAATGEIAAQAQADLEQAVSSVKQEGRRGRTLLIAIAATGVAVGLLSAAISIGVIIG